MTKRYDYKALCMPTNPFCSTPPPLNLYKKDEPIPILLALIMGLQHAFAMVGGLITPPLVVFKFAVCGFPFCPDLQQYAISASLITSGLCTLINVTKFPIPGSQALFGRAMYLGSGVLSVMGTSFTFLPIFEIGIAQMKADGIDGQDAYGKMLGTAMLCSLLELFFSAIPSRVLKRLFPPVVSCVTVILIGVALTGTGMKYWGGGAVCAEMGWKSHSTYLAVKPDPDRSNPSVNCAAGDVSLPYGSPEYIGLGFSVMCFLLIIELFGSVFMKNCNVVLALLFGYFVAAVSRYDDGTELKKYVLSDNIKNAEAIDFLWTTSFKLGIYGPAIVPMLIAFLVTTVETVGDISAVFEASEEPTDGEDYETSIQGGLTADGLNSILAGLFTSMPNTTFSQNNGVIAMTKCASRRAGYACGFWLILMGVLSKIAGIITSIPDCVIGGMTIFLFANVLVSGIALSSSVDLQERRNRFIFAFSLGLGVGVTIWPYAFQDMRASPYTAHFWTCADCSNALKGLRNGVSIFLSTGYCIGTVSAMLLNSILPSHTGGEVEAKTPDDLALEEKFDEDKDDEEAA